MGIQINGQTDTITAIDGSITVGTDLTVPGVLSYEDVTNIDSVGLITARSGIHVTGGSVGIGTDNPQTKLDLLVGGSSGGVNIHNNATGSAFYQLSTTANSYKVESIGSDFRIYNNTSSSEPLRINSSGNVGIGTDIVTQPFEVWAGTATTSFAVDSSGRVTMPYQPSFFATHSSGTGHLRPNTNNPFIFPLAPTNVGGHYNTSNGRFTAPISGRYWFQFSGGLMELDSQRGFDIRVNGSVFNGGEAWHPDGYQTIVSKSVLLTLNIDDYVTVTARSNVQLHQRYGNFCGFLIG